MLFQLIAFISLIIGIYIGEYFSNSIFGIMESRFQYIIDWLLFFTSYVIILDHIIIYKGISSFFFSFLYFLISFLLVIIVRGITTIFGIKAKKKEVIFGTKKEEIVLISIINSLKKEGLRKKEIINILVNAGFSSKKIEKLYNKSSLKNVKKN